MSGELVGRVTRTTTRLTTTEKLILVVLAEHVREKSRPGAPAGLAFPSVATIARHTEVNERTVQRALKKLRLGKWIEVAEQGGRGGRHYSPTQYKVQPEAGGDTDVTPRIDDDSAGGDICGVLGVTLVSPDPVRTPEKHKSRETPPQQNASVMSASREGKPETEKRLILKTPAKPNLIRRVIYTILDEQPDINSPDLADLVRVRLGVNVTASEHTIRDLVEAVQMKRAGLLPDRKDRQGVAIASREPQPQHVDEPQQRSFGPIGTVQACESLRSPAGVTLRPPVDAAEAERWRRMDAECAEVAARRKAREAFERAAQQPERLSATA